jgi:hypothetical protein
MDALFQKTLVRAGESRSFRIDYHASSSGWETCEESNHHIEQRLSRSDWHGVERDLARFAREIANLRQQGWSEA